jgi:radical SAM protein with 4Fe4S-binding SPASM domain
MDSRSYVISWNVTKLCNLQCDHCYIDAGPLKAQLLKNELSTEECFQVVDQIAEYNPNALLILTGGEPLLRKDIFEIANYANQKELWVVVGTNGVKITRKVVEKLLENGVKGVSLSLDSLTPGIHDNFRGIKGAWENTVNGSKILKELEFPFIIQTTISKINYEEIPEIVNLAYELGAKVYNLFFLVPTGRGNYLSNISPEQYEETMHRLMKIQEDFKEKMLVNSKCAPHYQRVLYETDPDSPFLKTFSSGAGGCPAGTHYCGIRPNGDMSPCPYLPVYGGNLREKSFGEIWNNSEVFANIRNRKKLGGRCGDCEFGQVCGGCRARAYGGTNDYMEEDPWCIYQPGKFNYKTITFDRAATYGLSMETQLTWTDEARKRSEQVPAFVRGKVIQAVEKYAREKGRREITPELMSEVKEKTMGRIPFAPSFLKKK